MPIFARRHYQAIAEVLKESYESTINSYTKVMSQSVIFKNSGLIELQAIKTFGVSVKERETSCR